MTIETVQQVVAEHFGMPVKLMRSPGRWRLVSRPRQIAMYLSRWLVGESYPRIGHAFGGRHHTTVLSACQLMERLWCLDGKLAGTVDGLALVAMARARAEAEYNSIGTPPAEVFAAVQAAYREMTAARP